jgi:hypothetical protein
MAQIVNDTPISLAELGRLLKILGLLGSSHDGEVLAAARKASEWVRDHSTSWEALLVPPDLPNPVSGVGVADEAGPAPGAVPTGQQMTWKIAAQAVLTYFPAVLRGPKEEDFVKGLLQKGWPKLTDKQDGWLRDICTRAGLSW